MTRVVILELLQIMKCFLCAWKWFFITLARRTL